VQIKIAQEFSPITCKTEHTVTIITRQLGLYLDGDYDPGWRRWSVPARSRDLWQTTT
jgi:hypothetical protein